MVSSLERGQGTEEDVDLLVQIADGMQGNTICLLADACAMPTRSIVSKFRDEFLAHVAMGRCPLGGRLSGRLEDAAAAAAAHADA